MSEKGSVFQKGGGGTNFEQAVQTAFLTTLIINGNAPCLPSNEIIEVSFQNTNKGYETDDLLVICKSTLGSHRMLIQIKHDISFSIDNDKFKEVMHAFWKDYNNGKIFDRTKDKLIIIKNGLTKDERNHLKSLFNWAKTHATETDFLKEVVRIDGKLKRLNVFRECLKKINNNINLTDNEIWSFLKCLDVLEYDFLNEGSVDEAYFHNLIKLSKSNESSQNAKEIWNDILAFASRLNKDGGNVTVGNIAMQDFFKSFSIEKLNPYYKGVKKLISDSEVILKPLKNTIGELHIDRLKIQAEITNSINSFQFTIVTGKPGVGKSSDIKDVLQNEFSAASKFVFRADQFNQPHLANVFSSQGVNETIQDLFSCIALTPNKILFIDSLEKLLEADPECAFKQLIALLKGYPDIKVIASSRKYAIDLIIQKYGLVKADISIVEVMPLNNQELDIVSEKFPQIITVLNNQKIKLLLQSPKYLDFAITALHKTPDNYSNITLTEFKNRLWNSLVVDVSNTKNGLPIKREKAFMEIAVNRAKEMKLFTKTNHSDAEAILMLERDEILIQEYQNRRYAPAHDILEDWALVRYVSDVYEDYSIPKDLFENLGNEPAIRRAFRLWVEDFLVDDFTKVNELIKATLGDNSIEKYWADELMVAVFKSEDCSSFFLPFQKDFFKSNSKLLNTCLHLIKTCCRESDFKSNNSTILLPIGSGWKEMLSFISKNLPLLENLRLTIVNFLGDWYYRLVFNYVSIENEELVAVKTIVNHYIKQIQLGQEFWQNENLTSKIQNLISIFYYLAKIAKEEIKALVENTLKNKNSHGAWRRHSFNEIVIDEFLSGIGNYILLYQLPELITQTAWHEWKLRPIKKSERGSIADLIGASSLSGDKCWGIEDKFQFFPSGIYKTPFYNLLYIHPFESLKFIIGFLNYSIAFYVKSDCDYKHDFKQIELELNDGTKVNNWAAWELWAAYRGTSVTHYAIESLLMSLEKFLLKTAGKKTNDSKAEIKLIFDYILRNSNNVATASVLTSVSIAFPHEVEEAMLPLLAVKEFYDWDLNRVIGDHTPLAIADDSISFAQDERHKFNNLPHRKKYSRGLRDFVLDYQFNIGIINKQIHNIFNKLKADMSPDDLGWKKTITEMDIRNHRVGDYDKNLGGYLIQPEYTKDVKKFIESNRAGYEVHSKSVNHSDLIIKAYEKKQPLEFSDWEICYEQYSNGDNMDTMYDRPVTLAIVGLRDFLQILNKKQKEWCIIILANTAGIIINNKLDRNFGLNSEFNLMEKDIVFSSFHLLFDATSNNGDWDTIMYLMVKMLSAPFENHEIDKIVDYVKTIFFLRNPKEGKKVWQVLIKYAQYKKANSLPYHILDLDKTQETKNKEDVFVKKNVRSKQLSLDFTKIDFQKNESHMLIRALLITPYYILDSDFSTFIGCIIPLVIDDLKKDRDCSHSLVKDGKQLEYQETNSLQNYLAELFLKAKSNMSQSVLDLIIDSVYKNDKRGKDDLFEFASNILKETAYKLDSLIANSSDEALNTQLISNFWNFWEYFYLKIKESGKLYFMKILFLDISWRKDASYWLPLNEKKDFYYNIINEFGIMQSQSIINVFSTIGEQAFLPEGLSWLVKNFKKDERQTISLISSDAERLIKRLFYNHISKIKSNRQLINDFIWILNKMVDLGSSDAYFFRENVITYKQTN